MNPVVSFRTYCIWSKPVQVQQQSPLHHLEERRDQASTSQTTVLASCLQKKLLKKTKTKNSASPTTVLASSLQYASASTQIKDLASREEINELYSLYQYSGPDGII